MTISALSALKTPDLSLLGLAFGVIDGITELDETAPDDAVFRSGVRRAIEERIPPHPIDLTRDWPPGRLPPGSTAADAAGMISGHIQYQEGPVTPLLAELAHIRLMFRVVSGGAERASSRARRWRLARWPARRAGAAELRLSANEAAELGARPRDRLWERHGRTYAQTPAGELTVAHTRLTLLPPRVPPEAWEKLRAGFPAWEVLGPFGMRREHRKATVARSLATVAASATLMLGDTPIGTTAEDIPPGYCAYVAALGG